MDVTEKIPETNNNEVMPVKPIKPPKPPPQTVDVFATDEKDDKYSVVDLARGMVMGERSRSVPPDPPPDFATADYSTLDRICRNRKPYQASEDRSSSGNSASSGKSGDSPPIRMGTADLKIKRIQKPDETSPLGASFTKFARQNFAGNATPVYSVGPLQQPLLSAKERGDYVAALACWISVLRIMGDMPDLDHSTSLKISGTSPDPLTKIKDGFVVKYTKKDLDEIHGKISEIFRDPSLNAVRGVPFLSSEKDTMLEKLQFVCTLGIYRREMRDEIYCQILKQLSKNPNHNSVARGWVLLYLCTGCFGPSDFFAPHLFAFLRESPQEVGLKCERLARGTLVCGTRGYPPSWLEFQAAKNNKPILLPVSLMNSEHPKAAKNNKPVLLPVSLMNTQRLLIQVEPSTSVNEFCRIVAEKAQIQHREGFSAYITLFRKISCLGNGQHRIMDAVAECEQYTRQMGMRESSATWRLYFRKELFAPWQREDTMDDRTVELIYRQISRGVTVGEYKCNKEEDMVQMAAKAYYIDHPDHADKSTLESFLLSWLPEKWQDPREEFIAKIESHARQNLYNRNASPDVVRRAVVRHARLSWGNMFSRCYDLSKFTGPGMVVNTSFLLVNSQGLFLLDTDDKVRLKFTYIEVYAVTKPHKTIMCIETLRGDRYEVTSLLCEDMYQLVMSLMEGLKQHSQYAIVVEPCHLIYTTQTVSDTGNVGIRNGLSKDVGSKNNVSKNEDGNHVDNSGEIHFYQPEIETESKNAQTETESTLISSKIDNSETEISKSEISKTEISKSENSKSEIIRSETSKTEISKTETETKHIQLLTKGDMLHIMKAYKDCTNIEGKLPCKAIGSTVVGMVDGSKVYVLPAAEKPHLSVIKQLQTYLSNGHTQSMVKDASSQHTLEEYAKSHFRRRGSDSKVLSMLSRASIGKLPTQQWIHTAEPMKEPLLKALCRHSVDLMNTASKAFIAMLQYSKDLPKEDSTTDDVTLVNTAILEPAVRNRIMRDEIYCQIMKQLTHNPSMQSETRYWQLLALLVGTCIPSNDLYTQCIHFLRTRQGKMVPLCIQRLSNLKLNGGRLFPPHPLEHTLIANGQSSTPVNVHFPDHTSMTTDVTSLTRCSDLAHEVTAKLQLASSNEFGLFYSITGKVLSVPHNEYLLDFLSYSDLYWAGHSPKSSTTNSVNLFFMKKLWFNSAPGQCEVTDTTFRYHQELPNYLRSYHKCSLEDAPLLGAYIFIAKYGNDSSKHLSSLKDSVCDFVPSCLLPQRAANVWTQDISTAVGLNNGIGTNMAKCRFLGIICKLKTYGSVFFEVKTISEGYPANALLAIGTAGLFLINKDTQEIIETFTFSKIPNWHYDASTFTLLVGDANYTSRIVLDTTVGHNIDDLIMDYITWLMNYHMSRKKAEQVDSGESDC